MALSQVSQNGEQQRLALTIERWLTDNPSDHYNQASAFLAKLNKKKKVITGGLGTQLIVQARYASNKNPTPEGVTDPFASRARRSIEGITRLKFDVAEKVMTFSLPKRDYKIQGNLTKKLDYVQTMLKIALEDWADSIMQTDLWAPEYDTGSAGSETQFCSFRTIYNKGGTSTSWLAGPPVHPAQLCAVNTAAGQKGNPGWVSTVHGAACATGYVDGNTPAAVTTIGGINRNAAGAAGFCVPTYSPATANYLPTNNDTLNTVILAGCVGNKRPDMVLMKQAEWAFVMGILQDQIKLETGNMTDYGFPAFKWLGCDFVADEYVPTGQYNATAADVALYQMFCMNTDNWAFYLDTAEPELNSAVAVDAPVTDYQLTQYGQLVPLAIGRHLGSRACAMKAAAS